MTAYSVGRKPGRIVRVSGIYGRSDGAGEIVAVRGNRFPPLPKGVEYYLVDAPRGKSSRREGCLKCGATTEIARDCDPVAERRLQGAYS